MRNELDALIDCSKKLDFYIRDFVEHKNVDKVSIDIVCLFLDEMIGVHKNMIECSQHQINVASRKINTQDDLYYFGIKIANEARIITHENYIKQLEEYKTKIQVG